MPDLKTVLTKLQGNPLQELKLYPQKSSDDINDMLSANVGQMFTDLSCGALTQDEIDFCAGRFANAVITNLVDRGAQADLDVIFSSTLSAYSAGRIDGVYLSQMLRKSRLPEPSAKVVYVVSDVSAAAKQYDVSRTPQDRNALLANIGAFYNNCAALYVLMDDDAEAENFRLLVNARLAAAGQPDIPPDFTLKNKLFDGLILRGSYRLSDSACDPDSVARVLADVILGGYLSQCLPTRTVESLLPSMIVFFNAARLSRATSSEIMSAKSQIGKMAGLDKSRIISFSGMASLGSVGKAMQKMQLMQNQLNNVLEKSQLAATSGKFVIRDINMDRVKEKLMRIEKRMKNMDVSKNPHLHNFDTFQRPNRREPSNSDLPGVSTDLGYYPDIHLYVDTSGSITEKDYEDSVAMIVDIAKRLGCDIYFNSFTTDISQEAVVRCRNRTKAQMRRDINRIPKLSGGTTIDQVWNYINATKKNRRQLSVLISDFYVDVPRYLKHPDNLYYIPTRDTSVAYAQKFATRLPDPWRVLF